MSLVHCTKRNNGHIKGLCTYDKLQCNGCGAEKVKTLLTVTIVRTAMRVKRLVIGSRWLLFLSSTSDIHAACTANSQCAALRTTDIAMDEYGFISGGSNSPRRIRV